LLVECDPAGGSSVLSGYLRGAVEHSRGLLALASAQRRDELEATLRSQAVALSPPRGAAETSAAGPWLLPGLSDAVQGPSTAALWGPLGSLLASQERAGIDVVVDAGRPAPSTHRPRCCAMPTWCCW
jgi:hypothetical protein